MEPVYVRHAHKAEKLALKLDTARNKVRIQTRCVAVTILDVGEGTFTLTFHFYDGTELTLDNTEVANGNQFKWDIDSLLLTNTAQVGKTLKLLTEIQVERQAQA